MTTKGSTMKAAVEERSRQPRRSSGTDSPPAASAGFLIPHWESSHWTYVAGPMTGIEDWNIPAFDEMAKRLRDKGLHVINPHELHDPSEDIPWDWYLRRDLVALAQSERVVLLPGWRNSRGASLEHIIAKRLGLQIIYPSDFEDWYNTL